MATQAESAKKEVHTILTEKVIEKLRNGIVPWKVSWAQAGMPENLVSGNQYRGINRILLTSLGYQRNLFLTSKQLKDIDGAILPDERPHVISYLSETGKPTDIDAAQTGANEGNKQLQLRYYTVFNIAQCKWPADRTFASVADELDPIQKSVSIKVKDQKRAYYDPLLDFINLPSEKNFSSKEEYCQAEFHQLMHSTGHHSRLNRKELIQMSEFGYDAYSHEELVTEIGTSYLMSHHGIKLDFKPSEEYLAGWIGKFERDRHLLNSAAHQAEKAISFLFLGESGYVQ